MLSLDRPLILASQSPRRRALLRQIGLDFTVQPSSVVEELLPLDLHPPEYATALARMKAIDVAYLQTQPSIVIGADTIVVLDGQILNKPADAADAHAMLRRLSGHTHTVFTGIALVSAPEISVQTAVQATDVRFRELDHNEIAEYVAGGSPMDKAGAYGIQDDFGAVFVEHIIGCYYNIVGLPLELLYRMLKSYTEGITHYSSTDIAQL